MTTRTAGRGIASLTLALLLGSIAPGRLQAHPLSQIGVRADIWTNRVEVGMDIKLEDLVWFQKLKAGESGRITAAELRTAAARHPDFLLKYFTLLDDQGRRLKGAFQSADTSGIPAAGASAEELTILEIHYRFTFSLASQPEFITFIQHFRGDQATVPSMMEVEARHLGVPLGKPVNLAEGVPYSYRLDWVNGPPPAPRSLADLRKQKELHRLRSLGMPDQNEVYSWYHVGNRHLRHYLVFPAWKLHRWVPLVAGPGRQLTLADRKRARPEISHFLHEHSSISTAQDTLYPSSIAVRFNRFSRLEFEPPPERGPLHLDQTRVGIAINYPAPKETKLRIKWDHFDRTMPFLKATLWFRGQAGRPLYFTAQRPALDVQSGPGPGPGPPIRVHLPNGGRTILIPPDLAARLLDDGAPLASFDLLDARLDENTFPPRQSVTGIATLRAVHRHWGHEHQLTFSGPVELRFADEFGQWRLLGTNLRGLRLINTLTRVPDPPRVSFIR